MIYADELENQGLKGIRCRIHTPAGEFRTTVPMPGRHMVYNALAGTAAGLATGFRWTRYRRALKALNR